MTTRNGSSMAWKIATGVLSIAILILGAMWGMVTVHADTTHKGSVHREEFDMHQVQETQRFGGIEKRLDRIETKLDLALAGG